MKKREAKKQHTIALPKVSDGVAQVCKQGYFYRLQVLSYDKEWYSAVFINADAETKETIYQMIQIHETFYGSITRYEVFHKSGKVGQEMYSESFALSEKECIKKFWQIVNKVPKEFRLLDMELSSPKMVNAKPLVQRQTV